MTMTVYRALCEKADEAYWWMSMQPNFNLDDVTTKEFVAYYSINKNRNLIPTLLWDYSQQFEGGQLHIKCDSFECFFPVVDIFDIIVKYERKLGISKKKQYRFTTNIISEAA